MKHSQHWSARTGLIWPTTLSALPIGTITPILSIRAQDGSLSVAIGTSNNSTQRAELLDRFGVAESADIVTVTVTEALNAWDGVFDLSGVNSAYSSTALACAEAGSGIDVSTSNTELAPPELYALALMTAGMSDVNLVVAAPDVAPALGMTALTGVFLTWDQAPCADLTSDLERRDLALRQVGLIAQIGEVHGGRNGVLQVTHALLALQQMLVLGETGPDTLNAAVISTTEAEGLVLSTEEQATVVTFVTALSEAEISWDTFAAGWSLNQLSSSRVLKRPDLAIGGAVDVRPTATMAPTATLAPTQVPEPTETATTRATATTAPVAAVAGPIDGPGSGVTAGMASRSPRWLLFALAPLLLLLLLLLLAVRRRRSRALIFPQRGTVWSAEELVRRRAGKPVAVAAVMQGQPMNTPVRQRFIPRMARSQHTDA